MPGKLISLEPDLLKDSIVAVHFLTEFDLALIPGLLYSPALIGGFKYSGGVVSPFQFPPQPTTNVQLQSFSIGQPTFVNDWITCRLFGNALIFNCKEKYHGWDRYSSEIRSFLKLFDSLEIAKFYSRIGVRYINILKETNIFTKLVEEFRVNLTSYQNVSTNIKTEIVDSKFKVIVNVGNDFLLQEKNEKVSVLDIDVFFESRIEDTSNLLSILEEAHDKEKDIFVKSFRKDFLDTLNPKYDS